MGFCLNNSAMNVPRIAIAGAVAVLPLRSFGLGIRATDQDPAAIARGRAFVATADNPSAIYYNPAGVAQLEGTQVRVGGYAISLKSHYEDPNGRKSETEDMLAPLPEIYFTHTMSKQPFSYGVGIYTPYGLVNEWPDNSTFRHMEGRVTYITINPVAAWKLDDGLFFAAGATLNYGYGSLTQTIFSQALFPPGGQIKFDGDDIDFGFNLGFLWQPLPKHSFGISYHSGTTMDWHGESKTSGAELAGIPSGTESATGHVHFPQFVIAGYSFRPTPEWNIEFNIDWTDWGSVDALTIKQGSGTIQIPLNWASSFIYEFGVTRNFGEHWRMSGGYAYTKNSVPSANFLPLVPDEDFHFFGIGGGWKGKHWSWDLAYQFGYAGERNVTGNTLAFPVGANANGKYDFSSHAVSLSVGYKL